MQGFALLSLPHEKEQSIVDKELVLVESHGLLLSDETQFFV